MHLPSARQLFRKAFAGKTADPVSAQPKDAGAETNFRWLTENSADVIMRLGPDVRASYVSPSCTRLLGWLPEEMVGRGPEDFIPPKHLSTVAATQAALMAGTEAPTASIEFWRKDGSTVWVEAKIRLIRDPVTSAPTDYVLILRDHSERKILEDRLSELAMTDGLTGLANRRAFDEALEREWDRAVQVGGQISLLLLDLDRFKGFNDTYGHQVGDDCLRAVAAAICQTVRRPTDVVARYGGEELAVILPDTDVAGAAEIAEQVRAAVERLRLPHIGNREGGGWVTVSIGAATALSRSGGTNRMPEGLLISADNALYKAKQNGRNRVETTLLLAQDRSGAA